MAVRGKIGSIITQVLDLVILTVIIFSTAFDFGEKDRNRVLTGAAEKDLSRGFKAGFMAAILDFLTVILLGACKSRGAPKGLYCGIRNP